MILSFVPRYVCGVSKSASLISNFFFHAHDWRITLFIVNKNSIAKQNRSSSETDSVEFPKSLVSVARRVLRKENQDNVHESNANENVKVTFKQLYPSISYRSRAGSTSKSKVASRKHSLRHLG